MGQTIVNILTSPLSLIDQRIGDFISGVAITVAGAITGNPALIAFGLSRIAGALKTPIKPATTEGAVKNPISPRIRAYGRSRLFGAYALFETSKSGHAIDVFAVHDGRIDGIEQRYLGDDKITLTGDAVNEGDDERYRTNAVRWYETLGDAVGTAFAALITLLPGVWTANHRGDGVVAIATTWKPVKTADFQKTYPQGQPTPASIVARWQPVFDWRDPAQDVTDPLTWAWSENALLHLAHYRLFVEKAYRAPDEAMPSAVALQAAWDLYFAPTLAYWTAAANVCDEAIALKAGGTEPRYRSCFSHRLTDPHKDVLENLTACFDGWTAPRADGALVVYAGKYYGPTVSIGPEHIVAYNWQDGQEDESSVNEITLSYISDEHDFSSVECDPWQDLEDISARGAIRSKSLGSAVPSNGQSRRLAKRLMARLMAPQRGSVTTNVAGRIARGQRYINLRIEEAGAVFFDGVAEISQLSRNMSTGGVTFSWAAADPNIDAWNPATEEGEKATAGTRVAADPLDPAEITAANVGYVGSTEEGTGARITILATGPARDDLVWFARWRIDGAAVWNESQYTDTDPSGAVELLTGFVPVNESIEVEVAYQIGDGRVSPWSTPATLVDTDIDATPPDAAADIMLTGWNDTLDLATTAIPRATSYRWRFYLGDGVTLKRTIVTSVRSVSYSKAQAAVDGVSREYIVEVVGVNGGGAGTAFTSAPITNDSPDQVEDVTGVDDATTGTVTFTPLAGVADLAGYVLYYSTTTGFDPLTEGFTVIGIASPIYVYGLVAGTYYAKMAAFDTWSDNPALLNFSTETTFVISAGGGGSGGGGGPGGGGGGYDGPIP